MKVLLMGGSSVAGATGVSRKSAMVCGCCSLLLSPGLSFTSVTRTSSSDACSALAGLLAQGLIRDQQCSTSSVQHFFHYISMNRHVSSYII
jgi:hypothetical protein